MDHVVARRFAVGVRPWRDELTSLEAMSQNDAAELLGVGLASLQRARHIIDLATVDRRPALSVKSFWESHYDPIEGRQAADLEALIDSLPRLFGA